MTSKTDIWVYADWLGMTDPELIGVLTVQQTKTRKSFSFSYERSWLRSSAQMLLDPDIQWYTGPQHPGEKQNFGAFLDSMPDTWGRTLMKRRAAADAKVSGTPARTLYDIDFLLGVFDESRMGGLRFKLHPAGPFLDDNQDYPIPVWSDLRVLQHGTVLIESDDETQVNEGLALLLAPGSSLGGARPKANVLDNNRHPWIAKFPSRNDNKDQAAWEFLAYRLATKAGIQIAESKMLSLSGPHHTFLTKRFDREDGARIHFASAMTMTGNSEDTIRDQQASYLDLALFLQNHSANIKDDLHQLWRRIIFNLMLSNTDDHLRNHGFLLNSSGWRLAPAYDLNPSIEKDHLALNIDTENNALDLDLARSVGEYFHLNQVEQEVIIKEVKSACIKWREVADELSISRADQEMMAAAFRLID
jgi:serine/threonine-protein kinase HipA